MSDFFLADIEKHDGTPTRPLMSWTEKYLQAMQLMAVTEEQVIRNFPAFLTRTARRCWEGLTAAQKQGQPLPVLKNWATAVRALRSRREEATSLLEEKKFKKGDDLNKFAEEISALVEALSSDEAWDSENEAKEEVRQQELDAAVVSAVYGDNYNHRRGRGNNRPRYNQQFNGYRGRGQGRGGYQGNNYSQNYQGGNNQQAWNSNRGYQGQRGYNFQNNFRGNRGQRGNNHNFNFSNRGNYNGYQNNYRNNNGAVNAVDQQDARYGDNVVFVNGDNIHAIFDDLQIDEHQQSDSELYDNQIQEELQAAEPIGEEEDDERPHPEDEYGFENMHDADLTGNYDEDQEHHGDNPPPTRKIEILPQGNLQVKIESTQEAEIEDGFEMGAPEPTNVTKKSMKKRMNKTNKNKQIQKNGKAKTEDETSSTSRNTNGRTSIWSRVTFMAILATLIAPGMPLEVTNCERTGPPTMMELPKLPNCNMRLSKKFPAKIYEAHTTLKKSKAFECQSEAISICRSSFLKMTETTTASRTKATIITAEACRKATTEGKIENLVLTKNQNLWTTETEEMPSLPWFGETCKTINKFKIREGNAYLLDPNQITLTVGVGMASPNITEVRNGDSITVWEQIVPEDCHLEFLTFEMVETNFQTMWLPELKVIVPDDSPAKKQKKRDTGAKNGDLTFTFDPSLEPKENLRQMWNLLTTMVNSSTAANSNLRAEMKKITTLNTALRNRIDDLQMEQRLDDMEKKINTLKNKTQEQLTVKNPEIEQMKAEIEKIKLNTKTNGGIDSYAQATLQSALEKMRTQIEELKTKNGQQEDEFQTECRTQQNELQRLQTRMLINPTQAIREAMGKPNLVAQKIDQSRLLIMECETLSIEESQLLKSHRLNDTSCFEEIPDIYNRTKASGEELLDTVQNRTLSVVDRVGEKTKDAIDGTKVLINDTMDEIRGWASKIFWWIGIPLICIIFIVGGIFFYFKIWLIQTSTEGLTSIVRRILPAQISSITEQEAQNLPLSRINAILNNTVETESDEEPEKIVRSKRKHRKWKGTGTPQDFRAEWRRIATTVAVVASLSTASALPIVGLHLDGHQ
ncbi:unnamed protein product, partial [Mesorhabditis spiculigera]